MTQRAIGLQAAGVGGRGLGRKRWGDVVLCGCGGR